MVELLVGFMFGRATKDMNPLQVCAGVIGALAVLSVVALTAWAAWIYAPEASVILSRIGILPHFVTDYLHIAPVNDGDVLGFLVQLPKRLIICVLAFTLFCFAIGTVLWATGLVFRTSTYFRRKRIR